MLSADVYKYWHIDLLAMTCRIIFQDGRVVEGKLEPEWVPAKHLISSSTFDWEKWWIFSTTTRGHIIITEGFNPNRPPPLHGRPSVYLDQNKWRTVADVLQDPIRISDLDEREAAQDLIRLAADGGVVLPLSTGHMLETGGLYGERRYEVGLAMASLSGGWQIRNPLDLWKQEAQETIRAYLDLSPQNPRAPIVTEPGAMFGSDTNLGISDQHTDEEILMTMLTMPNTVLNILIEPDSMPKHPLTNWVDHHARISGQVGTQNINKDQRRRLARRRYWNENIALYTAPYRELTNSLGFPAFSDRELAQMFSDSPMVGLLSEVFVQRFMNRQARWERNDLIDIFHLSSAAAYADYVCAEKHTGRQLQSAQRELGRRPNVSTSLVDMLAQIRGDGVRTESERQSG